MNQIMDFFYKIRSNFSILSFVILPILYLESALSIKE